MIRKPSCNYLTPAESCWMKVRIVMENRKLSGWPQPLERLCVRKVYFLLFYYLIFYQAYWIHLGFKVQPPHSAALHVMSWTRCSAFQISAWSEWILSQEVGPPKTMTKPSLTINTAVVKAILSLGEYRPVWRGQRSGGSCGSDLAGLLPDQANRRLYVGLMLQSLSSAQDAWSTGRVQLTLYAIGCLPSLPCRHRVKPANSASAGFSPWPK